MLGVTICIASVGRLSLLNTLQSVEACHLPQDVKVNVVIADDSANGGVESLLNKDAHHWSLPIQIVRVGVGNISIARNACLDVADGDYLVFIDDDEQADENWLFNFIEQAEKSGADAIFGPVDAIFPLNAPSWICEAKPFVKRVGEHGSKLVTGSTCNAIVRKSSIDKLNLRFQEKFGKTGGEDTDFFVRLYDAGALLIASNNAKVCETVPLERLSIKHLYRRNVRAGQTYACIILAKTQFFYRGLAYLMAFAKVFILSIIAILCIPIRKDLSLKFAIRIWLNIGKIRHMLGLKMFTIY